MFMSGKHPEVSKVLSGFLLVAFPHSFMTLISLIVCESSPFCSLKLTVGKAGKQW